MGLPVIKHPTFDLTIPSTKQTIKYRPFLVKEEKVLLLAQSSNNVNDMISAVKQIINNCIVEISKRIYWQYINKHVFKKDVKFTPAYYPTIRQLAGTYIQTKKTITKDYVLDIVNKFPTPLITSLINKTLLKL